MILISSCLHIILSSSSSFSQKSSFDSFLSVFFLSYLSLVLSFNKNLPVRYIILILFFNLNPYHLTTRRHFICKMWKTRQRRSNTFLPFVQTDQRKIIISNLLTSLYFLCVKSVYRIHKIHRETFKDNKIIHFYLLYYYIFLLPGYFPLFVDA